MKVKTWILILILGVYGVLALTYGINFVVDPYGRNFEYDLNINQRKIMHADRIEKLKFVEKNKEFNSFIFGSSRAFAIDPDTIDEILGTKTFNFAYTVGTMPEHYAIIRHLLETREVKHIMIALDLFAVDDTFDSKGMLPKVVQKYNSENKSFLIEYLSLSTLYHSVKTILNNINPGKAIVSENPWRNKGMDYYGKYIACQNEKGCIDRHAQGLPHANSFWYAKRISKSQINLIKDLYERSLKEDFKLSLFMNPLFITQIKLANNKMYLQKQLLKEIVSLNIPVWDFTNINSININPYYYKDFFHYNYFVADFIVWRMFNRNTEFIPKDFGVKLSKDNIEEYLKELEEKQNQVSLKVERPKNKFLKFNENN